MSKVSSIPASLKDFEKFVSEMKVGENYSFSAWKYKSIVIRKNNDGTFYWALEFITSSSGATFTKFPMKNTHRVIGYKTEKGCKRSLFNDCKKIFN